MADKFEIRDKRTMDSQGNPRTEPPAAGAAPKPSAPPGSPAPETKRTGPQGRESGGDERPVREDQAFLPFVMNLASMAYMTLGLGMGVGEAGTGLDEGGAAPNLPEAKYIIDSLDMLAGKTRGNLSPEEEKGLRSVIYELKMQFTRVSGQSARK
ncbi:MAG: DUF1844 domain-containing protein [Nitrospiraceae bacterium]|nr:DUF1844 domain-containing protein [Nitrospiraceae bacterium]